MTTLLFDGRYMKRHLNDAEQQESLSDLTKYWACHEKWHSKISEKFSENGWSVIYKKWQLNFTKYCRMPRKLNVNPTSPNWMFNLIATSPNSAPATKLTVELHQRLQLPRKLNVQLNFCTCHEKCTILWLYYSFALPVVKLYYSFALLFFDSSSLLLYYSLTLLFFYSTILWLCYSFTPVFFDFNVLLLYYSFILWLY